MKNSSSKPSGANTSTPRPHLPFLDGIRGLAALFVLLGHTYHWLTWSAQDQGENPIWLSILRPLSFPVYAVDMFIVLSGFCLMLPVVARGNINSTFPFRDYFYRRAKRIYPPYLAALFFSLLLLVFQSSFLPLKESVHSWPSSANLLAHILLIHNWHPEWARSINDPMWSVATEWQIYFLFPLFLLPLSRRFGSLIPVFAGLVLGWGLLVFSQGRLMLAAPWLIGLFAMGMAGAQRAFSPQGEARQLHRPWLVFFVGGTAVFGAIGMVLRGQIGSYQYLADPVFGVLSLCLILALCSEKRQSGGFFSAGLLRLFESRFALWLGRISYSIYLLHYPLLIVVGEAVAQRLELELSGRLLLASIYLPCSLALSYLFHLAFERPFISAGNRKLPSASQ